ncbi:hypothetical protein [Corynebacterium cystitidis]|uniref:ABC-2 type transport system permease protein n=1 Tax=Corynebacterium cystitidis DSM 20524 TaxID=1121357 RepID=A0A1H9UIC4_9CORY|nr:hypothetical protein [Corynebacterium cystitidis]WJY83750.1 hypothetical protein CCYS_14355 [Corynebacterium cystitidis DSM 20524]SES09038.1 ABC-2 type transport system permease protein [Corynebacterium cystitidis DSM 20524]SNV90966.1 ABC-type transporter, permease component [Corynebacterium cystitidis]
MQTIHNALTLTRLNLTLKRGYLLAWILPILAITAIFPYAYFEYYPTLADRQGVVQGLSGNIGTRAIYGLIDAPGTVGQMTTWEAAMWTGLLGAIMIALLMADLYRRPEHTGLAELTRSTGIRANTPWIAATITGVMASVTIGALSSLILILLPLPREEIPIDGAVAFGITLILVLVGSMLSAQVVLLLVNDGATLTRTVLLSVALSYVIRIVADTQDIAWLNWASPLGWREIIGPFTENDYTRAGILATVCAVAGVLIGLLESQRPFAQGFIPARDSSHRARPIRGIIHLRWALNKGGILAWMAIVGISTAFLMSLSGDIAELIGGEATTGQVFRDLLGGTDAYQAFIAYICQMITIMIAAAGIGQITTYRAEEKARTVDAQRSTGVRRYAPLAAASVVALGTVIALIAVMHASGALGLASQEATLDDDYCALAWSSWTLLGAALLLTGIAVAIVGCVPRATGWAWVPLAASAVVTLMGEILQLPDWVIDLSPLSYALEPGSDQWWIPVLLGATGVVLVLVGLVGSSKRDIR